MPILYLDKHSSSRGFNAVTPRKAELVRGNRTLRVGDRVIQQVNDYEREVSNGDLGIIADIGVEEVTVTVQFGQRRVNYDLADLNEIALAWVVS